MQIVWSIFLLIGGVGAFMLGLKLMSEGLERSAGKGMQKLFSRISGNRFAGLGVGAAVTGIIQSSSATTVMIIGFVNAGVMTLAQATAIIFGANIGTTVTGLLASLSAFKISVYLGAFSVIGFFVSMFAKNEKAERTGQVMSGVGLVFVALEIMSAAIKTPEIKEAILNVFGSISGSVPIYPLILVLVSVVVTGIVQSSSVVTGVVLIMVGAGFPLEYALYIVIGANMGTCVTALLASIGTSVNAKRAAVIHLLFNVVGSVIFLTVVWIFSGGIIWFLEWAFPPEFQVSVFHLVFNLATAFLALPFIKYLVKLATILVPDKKGVTADKPRFSYIDELLLQTPPIAIVQVKKEIKEMADVAKRNLERGMNAILRKDVSERAAIERDEARINFLNKGLAVYLIKLSAQSASKSEEGAIGAYHHVISDVERIGDHAVNFSDRAAELAEGGVNFSETAIEELEILYRQVLTMYDAAVEVLMTGDSGRFPEIAGMENEIDEMRKRFNNNHISRLQAGLCSVDSGPFFYALLSALERIGDHLTNIAFSIKSPSGSQHEAMAIVEREAARAAKFKH
jgi:phosphate:Na+ symporter